MASTTSQKPSFGALPAFEYVREVRRRAAERAEVLVVSGQHPPDRANGYDRYLALSDDELYAQLSGLALPPDLPTALREVVLDRVRVDIRLGARYRYHPEPALDVPIVMCHGHDDHTLAEEALSGWRSHTNAGFRLLRVAGDHHFYLSYPETVVAAAGMEAA
jgi:medium-chain acyl-[acyl-carrier-protein] hydrolase